jgi:predicted flavoprotein YhiN
MRNLISISFLAKFGESAKFLFSPFSRFGVQDTLDFFHAHGMPTKVEAEKRVFPASESSQSVWDALAGYMREGHVTIHTGSQVSGIEVADGLVSGVRLKDGDNIQARSFVLATGGKSHPETGSTGGWIPLAPGDWTYCNRSSSGPRSAQGSRTVGCFGGWGEFRRSQTDRISE